MSTKLLWGHIFVDKNSFNKYHSQLNAYEKGQLKIPYSSNICGFDNIKRTASYVTWWQGEAALAPPEVLVPVITNPHVSAPIRISLSVDNLEWQGKIAKALNSVGEVPKFSYDLLGSALIDSSTTPLEVFVKTRGGIMPIYALSENVQQCTLPSDFNIKTSKPLTLNGDCGNLVQSYIACACKLNPSNSEEIGSFFGNLKRKGKLAVARVKGKKAYEKEAKSQATSFREKEEEQLRKEDLRVKEAEARLEESKAKAEAQKARLKKLL